MAQLTPQQDGSLVKEVPVPKLNEGDVLVKVAYVSQVGLARCG